MIYLPKKSVTENLCDGLENSTPTGYTGDKREENIK